MPPPMNNSHDPPHPQSHPQEYDSASGWHVDNHQHTSHEQPMGPYPRQFVEGSRQYNQLGSTYQFLPMAQPISQHMYYALYPPALLPLYYVPEHGWHRPQHDQESPGWDDHRRGDYQQFPVRSSIQMANGHVPRQEAEKQHGAISTEDWTVSHEIHPRRQRNSTCSSSDMTASSSSTTTRAGRLTKAERIEYTTLIKDLWRSAPFAEEFKEYSAEDYVRVKELLDRLPHDGRPI